MWIVVSRLLKQLELKKGPRKRRRMLSMSCKKVNQADQKRFSPNETNMNGVTDLNWLKQASMTKILILRLVFNTSRNLCVFEFHLSSFRGCLVGRSYRPILCSFQLTIVSILKIKIFFWEMFVYSSSPNSRPLRLFWGYPILFVYNWSDKGAYI